MYFFKNNKESGPETFSFFINKSLESNTLGRGNVPKHNTLEQGVFNRRPSMYLFAVLDHVLSVACFFFCSDKVRTAKERISKKMGKPFG